MCKGERRAGAGTGAVEGSLGKRGMKVSRAKTEYMCLNGKPLGSVTTGLYRMWCGVNRLGDSAVHTLGDTSAFVNPAGQLYTTSQFRGVSKCVEVT